MMGYWCCSFVYSQQGERGTSIRIQWTETWGLTTCAHERLVDSRTREQMCGYTSILFYFRWWPCLSRLVSRASSISTERLCPSRSGTDVYVFCGSQASASRSIIIPIHAVRCQSRSLSYAVVQLHEFLLLLQSSRAKLGVRALLPELFPKHHSVQAFLVGS